MRMFAMCQNGSSSVSEATVAGACVCGARDCCCLADVAGSVARSFLSDKNSISVMVTCMAERSRPLVSVYVRNSKSPTMLTRSPLCRYFAHVSASPRQAEQR